MKFDLKEYVAYLISRFFDDEELVAYLNMPSTQKVYDLTEEEIEHILAAWYNANGWVEVPE